MEVLQESHDALLAKINAEIARLPEGDTASISDPYASSIIVNANQLIAQFCASQDDYKNINLNYSVGKVRLRPWAEKGGRIATNATTFNRELLIVEKDNDGKPFELHTSYEDKENYYRNLRNPWLLILLMFAIFAVAKCSVVFGVLALVSLIPVLVYQTQVMQNKREGKTKEW